MRTLYWHTDDLRLEDNPALALAAQSDALACVYVLGDSNAVDEFGNEKIGAHRQRFIQSALAELDESYQTFSQKLQIVSGDAEIEVSQAIRSGRIERVIQSRQHGVDEKVRWQKLQAIHPDVNFFWVDTSTLFSQSEVQFTEFPNTFSKFRRRMEQCEYRTCHRPVSSLPASIQLETSTPVGLVERDTQSCRGGSQSGLEHLQSYFATRAASSYKETRNQFMGERFSTGFSPWLAQGCLSPQQIVRELRSYEDRYGANDSTGWIIFELLWREYFRWYGAEHGVKLFKAGGLTNKPVVARIDAGVFESWCTGTTDWPIVNACMRELNATGWMSNRGRQLVASCLINELAQDWRAGAGYFEQQLIDYDPCSNWGNWQYIAGVGADPRGGRHFDLVWQSQQWDPDQTYQKHWQVV